MKQLEWNRFLNLASGFARSAPAKNSILALIDEGLWAKSLPEARSLQRELSDAMGVLNREALWAPLAEIEDPAPIFESLQKKRILDLSQARVLKAWLEVADAWSQVPLEEFSGEIFKNAIVKVSVPQDVLQRLQEVIGPDGEMLENASPELARISSQLREKKRAIETRVQDLLNDYSRQGILQENFYDVRDGRYVLPIKLSAQQGLNGIIYEASVSKKTVYFEPREIEIINNDLRKLENDRAEEVYRILEEISTLSYPYLSEIEASVEIIVHWDGVQAKARFGQKFSAKPIEVGERRCFQLRGSAHPLLWWSVPEKAIVRNTIELQDDKRALFVSGPNTGGKTVLLKLLGLAAVCARTGFPFPGETPSVVPFVDRIFMDLGDPQSLEENLSSFSGHVLKMKEMLSELTSQSLLLVDELNSATDPEEGAALSRAFLETIVEPYLNSVLGPIVVITTHDPILKNFALTQSWIQTISLRFNEKTNEPMYEVVQGVPGRSRALDTAQRLGVPAKILDKARSYLSKSHQELEKGLSMLEGVLQKAHDDRREAQVARQEAERLRADWSSKVQSLVGEEWSRLQQRLKGFVLEAQEQIREVTRTLQERRSFKRAEDAKAEIKQAVSTATTSIQDWIQREIPEFQVSKQEGDPTPKELQAGSWVRVPKWKSRGKVTEMHGSKFKVVMDSGMTMMLPLADVVQIDEPILQNKNTGIHYENPQNTEEERVSSSLDLRGLRYEDGMQKLELYLDRAFRSGYGEVMIIHGLGSGALREGARSMLEKLSYVESFNDGGPGAGGAGSTRVRFGRV